MTTLAFAAVLCGAGAFGLLLAELVTRRASATAIARVASYGRARSGATTVATDDRRRSSTAAVGRVLIRLVPGRDREATAAQLRAAGLVQVAPETFVAAKALLALLGVLLGVVLGSAIGAVGVLLGVVAAIAGFVGPDLVLRSRTTSRRDRIVSQLPNALDLLAVIVEAGLGLDGALVRYAETAEGPLAEEIALVTAELRVGVSRAEVLARLAGRVPTPGIKAFVRAVSHADRLGVSLAGTLTAQAHDARRRSHALAEEQANKMPVKILFPMVFCIFPMILLVVVGPPLMHLMGTL